MKKTETEKEPGMHNGRNCERKAPIRAIFLDIDGTLRDFDTQRIPDSAKSALERARRAGIMLFIATGRHKLEMEEENLLEGLEFDGYVTLNGQYCYCGSRLVHGCPVPSQDVQAVLRMLKEDPFPCMFMEAEHMYINMADDMVKEAQAGIGTRIPPIMDVGRAANHTIYQMVPYIGPEQERRLKQELPSCQFIRWHDGNASDIIPMGGSKSEGIRAMIGEFGIAMEEAAAIGDGSNDVSMVKEAGLGIAMGNGKDALKEAADYVTGPVGMDGLREAVDYILEYNRGLTAGRRNRVKYKAVIFDFDYTLGDSTEGIAASVNHGLEKLGYEARGLEDIRKTIGLSLKETFACLTGSRDREKAQRFCTYFKEKSDQVMVDNTRIYQTVRPVLEKLREQGCRIGIVTTKYHYRIDQILDKFQMAGLVDMIVGAEDVKAEKPSPEGLLYAMEQLGMEREEVLYTGDSVVDAKTAARAGVDFAGVLTGTTALQEFEPFGHVCIVRDLEELLEGLTAWD